MQEGGVRMARITKAIRDKIWELYYSGMTPGEIARKLNITEHQVVTILGIR